MINVCDKCVSDKSLCATCRDHPEVRKILATLPKRSHFATYIPVCPRGYIDCVYDPAYIKDSAPNWYKDLYGDVSPEEAIYSEGGCWHKFLKDPDENYYCYDDEDK